MAVEPPRLLFAGQTRRRPHIRRMLWSLLAALSGLTMVFAFEYVRKPLALPETLADVGKLFSLAVFAVFSVRAIFALGRVLRTKTESFKFFDRGFVWQRAKQAPLKYSYNQLTSWREAYTVTRWGQRGAIVFKTQDGHTYRITPTHGRLNTYADTLRPILTELFGTRMARALRDGQAVRAHPKLTLMGQGLKVNGQAVRWRDVDVVVRGDKLVISKRAKSAKFSPVATFRLKDVENLGGFLDVALGAIQTHQPERFGIETQIGKVVAVPSRKS